MSNLYENIGEDTIRQVITKFYQRAFVDPIIGHFFFDKDIEDITAKQIDFATAMLGGPRRYKGKPLEKAHADLNIRHPHFGRRQVLMREVLDEIQVAAGHAARWLEMEESLRPKILRQAEPCR